MFGFSVMERDNEILRVSWGEGTNVKAGFVHVENLYGSKHIRAMDLYEEGSEYDISFNRVMKFLETRTVPRTRYGINDLLRKLYRIREYNPMLMVQKDHGVQWSDFAWVRFFGEELTFDDIRVR